MKYDGKRVCFDLNMESKSLRQIMTTIEITISNDMSSRQSTVAMVAKRICAERKPNSFKKIRAVWSAVAFRIGGKAISDARNMLRRKERFFEVIIVCPTIRFMTSHKYLSNIINRSNEWYEGLFSV